METKSSESENILSYVNAVNQLNSEIEEDIQRYEELLNISKLSYAFYLKKNMKIISGNKEIELSNLTPETEWEISYDYLEIPFKWLTIIEKEYLAIFSVQLKKTDEKSVYGLVREVGEYAVWLILHDKMLSTLENIWIHMDRVSFLLKEGIKIVHDIKIRYEDIVKAIENNLSRDEFDERVKLHQKVLRQKEENLNNLEIEKKSGPGLDFKVKTVNSFEVKQWYRKEYKFKIKGSAITESIFKKFFVSKKSKEKYKIYSLKNYYGKDTYLIIDQDNKLCYIQDKKKPQMYQHMFNLTEFLQELQHYNIQR